MDSKTSDVTIPGRETFVLTCPFCNKPPITQVFPTVAMLCSGCGVTIGDVPGVTLESLLSDPVDTRNALANAWNAAPRGATRAERLFHKVTYQLALLAKVKLPNGFSERYAAMYSVPDEAKPWKTTEAARRRIVDACPAKYRDYLVAELAYLDCLRDEHVSRAGRSGVQITTQRGEKTYTLEQLRGAWGAGFRRGKEEAADA